MAVALFLFRFVSVCVCAQNTLKLVKQIQLSHKATHSPMHVTQGISKNKKKKKVTVQKVEHFSRVSSCLSSHPSSSLVALFLFLFNCGFNLE